MNYSKYRISLDIHDTNSQAMLNIKKDDTARKVYFSLTDGGRPYQIAEGCTAVLRAKKPDGTILYNDCTINDNVIEYTLTQQTSASVGIVDCEVTLYGSDSRQITSPRFVFVVEDNLYSDSEIESTDEFTALTEAMVGAEKVNASVSKLDDTVTITITDREGTDHTAEVKDGTNGKDGYTPQKGVDYFTEEDVASLNIPLVDQAFNPISENAQSGTAVAEAIVSHNENQTAHEDMRTSITEAKTIAMGKANSLVFDTKEQLDSWVGINENLYYTKTISDTFNYSDYESSGGNVPPVGGTYVVLPKGTYTIGVSDNHLRLMSLVEYLVAGTTSTYKITVDEATASFAWTGTIPENETVTWTATIQIDKGTTIGYPMNAYTREDGITKSDLKAGDLLLVEETGVPDGYWDGSAFVEMEAQQKVDQTYSPTSENAQSGIAIAEAIRPVRQTITIDTPIWETQPTIEGALSDEFKTWESSKYYMTLKDADGNALESGKFKLTTTLDGYASAIGQIFTLNGSGITLTENFLVDFKSISSDRLSFEMRNSGVSSIKITPKNLKSQRYIFSVYSPIGFLTKKENRYLYFSDSIGFSLGVNASYYSAVGKYTGYSGFLYRLADPHLNILNVGFKIDVSRSKIGINANISSQVQNTNTSRTVESNYNYSIYDPSKIEDAQQEDISWFQISSYKKYYYGNGTIVTLEEFA